MPSVANVARKMLKAFKLKITSRWEIVMVWLTHEGWTIVKSVCPEDWTRDMQAGRRPRGCSHPQQPGVCGRGHREEFSVDKCH